MKFKVGEIVKCIKVGDLNSMDGDNPPLKLNAEYIVNYIHTCKCGRQSLGVGIPSPYGWTMCGGCNNFLLSDSWLCHSSRFIKRQSIEDQIKEAVEKEDYEYAHELTILKNKS